MKRVFIIVVAAALIVGVSLPAAALAKADPNAYQVRSAADATLASGQQGVDVAVAAGTVDVSGGYSSEPKPPPVPVIPAGVYTGPVPNLANGPFELWPFADGYIHDGFGPRTDGSGEFHEGIDILGTAGEPIAAVATGTVVKIDMDDGYGQYVEIDLGDGVTTLYAHMIAGSPTVTPGQVVQAGQTIGLVGETGYATAYHTHFEVTVNGEKTDPVPFFDPAVIRSDGSWEVQTGSGWANTHMASG